MPEVDGTSNQLLSRSHAVDPPQSRVILQTLRIDRVPLSELAYKCAGVERKLWICGREQEVYAPKAPWNRGLFTALTGAAVLAVVGLIAGMVYLLMRLVPDEVRLAANRAIYVSGPSATSNRFAKSGSVIPTAARKCRSSKTSRRRSPDSTLDANDWG